MKIKVGDIIRSKDNMNINILDGDIENIKKGDYFVVIDYGDFEEEDEECEGWTLLSQKNKTKSRWDKEYCSVDEWFIKE